MLLQAGLLPDVTVGMGDDAVGCFHPSHGITKGRRGHPHLNFLWVAGCLYMFHVQFP